MNRHLLSGLMRQRHRTMTESFTPILDDAGGWKMKLVQELKTAGFDVDANRVFQT